MNLNSYILKDYLHIPILYTNLNSSVLERPLQSITFYQSTLLSDTHLAVIIQPDDLKKILPTLKAGCFLCPTDHVFDLHSCKADIILIENYISIFEIYEDLRKIFLEFEQLDQKMNQLVRQDAAINLFGNTLLKYLWNPISLYSEDMRLIFYSERKKPMQYQIYFEDELNQYLPDEEIEDLKIDKEYNETINAFEPAIFSAARWGYRILFYNIRIDDVYVARLMILETDRPLKQSDYPLLVYLADFVTYMMDKKKLTLNNHPRFLDECLEAFKKWTGLYLNGYAPEDSINWGFTEMVDNFIGGLTGTLKAHHHDDAGLRAAQVQFGCFAAEQGNEFVMHSFDELLRGGQAFFDFLAEHALTHTLHEFLDDLEVDVGFQQGKTHLAQAIADIFLGELRPAAQGAERAGQPVR